MDSSPCLCKSHIDVISSRWDATSKVGELVTNFGEPPFSVEMSAFWLKHMYSILSALA